MVSNFTVRILSFSRAALFTALGAVFASGQIAIALQVSQASIMGHVRDGKTGTPIPSAIVRVMQDTRGTVCNSEGNFQLRLEPGKHVLVASSIGFIPDTVHVTLPGHLVVDFSLEPADIVMPEIVVTGEDPAYAIIRKAIDGKRTWMDRLKSYQMEAFTRQVLRRDTTIASITEAFTTGYWRQGDTLREVTTQRRQTANIEEEFNFASVGRLLNFNDEEISFVRHSFAGPIADDAFDHYDYKLLRTRTAGTNELYEIAIIPLSATVPRFRGTISIAGGTYALVGVDVEPNEAFLLPFIREKTLRYRQQFAQFEGAYWLPVDIAIDARFSLGVPGFSFPTIGFAQSSVITDYEINVPLPDSLFRKPRLVVDSAAAAFDSTVWAGPEVLPLTSQERSAYETLDSTQTLDVQFRPGGIAMTLGMGADEGSSLLRFLDLEYNRVEGAHLGGSVDLEKVTPWLDVRGGIAYGFSDRKTKVGGGFTVYTSSSRTWGFGAEYAKALRVIPGQEYYGKVFNSLTSVLVRNDYRDYYLSRGWTSFIGYSPSRYFRSRVTYTDERHMSVAANADFGVFGGSPEFRANPGITEGRLRSMRVDVAVGRGRVPFDIVLSDGLDVSVEFSDPGFAGSGFDFVRYHAVGTLFLPTFSRRFFSQPGFGVRLAAGASAGDLPGQRVFNIESSSSGVGPFGVMRAMRVKEFAGVEYIALNLEHNFRSIPFLALGIPWLYENNIEIILHGGIAQTWNKGRSDLPATNGWYSEAGFGIGRIFELIRADFTWRLSAPSRFCFTVGVSNIL